MIVFVIEKQKGRKYKSEDIIRTLFNLELAHNEDGMPLIDGACISISDTKNYWVCAKSDVPIGIDIEEPRSIRPNVSKRLHKKEQEYLAPLSEGSREWTEEFLSIWVRKEAYMKLMGKGFKLGLSSFSVIDNDDIQFRKIGKLYFGYAGDLDCNFEYPAYEAPFEVSCLDAAAGILDAGLYTEAEIIKKLTAKGYPKEDINEAVRKLSEYGYVNDSQYAKTLAEKLSKSGKAPKRIALELQKKGVSKELAREAADEYHGDVKAKALSIAKKTLGDLNLNELDREEKQKKLAKVCRKLASLGYESEIIYDIIERRSVPAQT